jgi:hypothetical protein
MNFLKPIFKVKGKNVFYFLIPDLGCTIALLIEVFPLSRMLRHI